MTVILPPKRCIARAFGNKAAIYSDNAKIQTAILHKLVPRIISTSSLDGMWLDLGCGPGVLEMVFAQESRKPSFVGADLAFESLAQFPPQCKAFSSLVQTDIEHLPFRAKQFDGAVIASVLQWIFDPAVALKQIYEVLNTKGTLIFSVFLAGSFHELYSIRQEFGMSIPITIPDDTSILSILQNAQFDVIETEPFCYTEYFGSVTEALKSIGGIGGNNVAERRLNRKQLKTFCHNYDTAFRTEKGIPISYRILLGTCTKG